jgi:hypothetical protein
MKTKAPGVAEKAPAARGAVPERDNPFYIQRHFKFGWWSLSLFLTLGIVLESLHGFKVGWYLNVSNETRRLMWTLAHAHGTLLSLIHIAFGATLNSFAYKPSHRALISSSLMGATLLVPGGFLLGGVVIYAGDPGLGILLVPVGALLLLVAVVLIARGIGK